ncbi:hypothetical protein EDD16DRAFT_1521098 [Pisolithus croceorrhizus]|nr:hypothetical protein EDD16DRAFT_1521098 [Pisolithus croceorrhizus]
MKFLASIAVLSTFAAGVFATAIPATPFVCQNEKVLSTYTIGKNNEVEAQVVSCSNLPGIASRSVAQKRQTDVCGNTCTTNCFTPSGGGPNPNDCQVIADALLYDNQNIGTWTFRRIPSLADTFGKGTPIFMQYASCETFFVNQATYNETYCRNDWSQENAHGGNCVASDQSWFIQ